MNTMPEGAFMNERLALTKMLTGSAFAVANNSWSVANVLEKLKSHRRKPGGILCSAWNE